MADTQRTRAALIALFADNVTGQISAQDLRDFLVTIMETEFTYAGDFWKQPSPRNLSTDRTGVGWKDYSQEVTSTCSFGNIMQMDGSGAWALASFGGISTNITTLGIAMESYTQGTSACTILRKGLYYHSLMSAAWTGSIGRTFVVLSANGGGAAGSMTRVLDQDITIAVGAPEATQSGDQSATAIFRFDPQWAIML